MRVLQSFPAPRMTTNPYLVMLARSLDALPGVSVLTFSWGRALTARYDVVHLHWPEILTTGNTPARTALRRAMLLVLLLRWTLTGVPVVRTWHNVRPHQGGDRVRELLLRWIDRLTRVGVRLNEETPAPGVVVTVPHGHYRDWFAPHPAAPPVRRRLAFVGLIRPYKDVPALLRAFAATAAHLPDAQLTVAGAPEPTELAGQVERAAGADTRVTVRLEYLDDAALVETVTTSRLVVLPYAEMHNSGAALMALSLDRPVLVPDNPVNRRLAAEVGEAWVRRYAPPLTGEALAAALDQPLPPGRPDLSGREWDDAGERHLAAYRRARELGRRRGRRR